MNERPNPFDKFGHVTDLPEEELDKLDDAGRSDYFVLVSAALGERDAMQAVEDGKANLAAIVSKLRDLQASFDQFPKPNQIDDLRQVIAAQNAARFGLPYESPTPDPQIEKLRQKIDAADAEAAQARELVGRLEADLREKRDALSQALVRYRNGPVIPPHEAYRDHLKRLKAYEANGGEYVEAPTAGPASHLDAILSSGAGGRHLSVNRGFGRSVRQRGLPSQR
jgi:hypothetical protein